jgi:AcrR family transcriptional regulator
LPALATGLIGLAAALPSSASAAAQPRIEAVVPSVATVNGSLFTPQAVQELLAQIPAGGSGGIAPVDLEVPKLAKVLVELPGISGLPALSGPGGTEAVEAALEEAIDKLLAHEELPLGELLSPQKLTAELLPKLEASTGLPIATLVEALLHKSPEAVLNEGLSSVDLSELLAKLLGSSENPTQLIDELLEKLNPATLEALLGSLPTGSPVQNLSLAELAAELAKTPQALAESLGQSLTTLPETAEAATQALSGGNELALIKGVEGLSFGLVERANAGAGAGGDGGGSGSATNGSNGANGGKPGSSTVIVMVPASSPPSATPTTAAAAAIGKVKIISHKVSGNKATLVVQVPSAGRLTVSGSGFKKVTQQTAKAERVTVHTTLTKARAASLHKHHNRRTSIKLTSTFVPISGHSSAASASVSVR